MAEAKVTVSIEAAMHKAMAKVAKEFADEYGIRLERVEFDWVDRSIIDSTRIEVSATRIESTYLPGLRRTDET